jgi:hypothetical protein
MDDARRCTATSKRSRKRCRRAARRGATTCQYHGASAPQVRAKANERVERAAAEAEWQSTFGGSTKAMIASTCDRAFHGSGFSDANT